MAPRFTLAWQTKENNPALVQDNNALKSRLANDRSFSEWERYIAEVSCSKPQVTLVSLRSVFERAGMNLKDSAKQKRNKDTSIESSCDSLNLPPLTLASLLRQGGVQPRSDVEDPYLAAYQEYLTQRSRMQEKRPWNSRKSAEDIFEFTKLELVLARLNAISEQREREESDDDVTEGSFSSCNGWDKETLGRLWKGSGKRVVINLEPTYTTMTPRLHFEDAGIESLESAWYIPFDDIIRMGGTWRRKKEKGDDDGGDENVEKEKKGPKDNESMSTSRAGDGTTSSERATPSFNGKVPSPSKPNSQPDLMSRFYARLQELQDSKLDDDQTTQMSDALTRNRDRLRIKTALRRLLTDRLFPDDAKTKRSKTQGPPGEVQDQLADDLASGTVTPLTLGSRAKTTMSLRSRTEGSTRATTRMGTQGRVLFVGEQL